MKGIEKIKEELERIVQEVDKRRTDYIRAKKACQLPRPKGRGLLNPY